MLQRLVDVLSEAKSSQKVIEKYFFILTCVCVCAGEGRITTQSTKHRVFSNAVWCINTRASFGKHSFFVVTTNNEQKDEAQQDRVAVGRLGPTTGRRSFGVQGDQTGPSAVSFLITIVRLMSDSNTNIQ